MTNENALTVTEGKEPVELSVADVKKHIAPNATDKELFYFMNIAKSYGLNPFKREIHFVKYGNDPGQSIVGYEIYLKRAEATGKLDGWNVTIVDTGTKNERAVITIYRKDRTHPFVWEVARSEFDRQQATWKAMPHFMLKKVAIAQGFRLAFPEDLGGMPYIPEEIPNPGNGGSESLPPAPSGSTSYPDNNTPPPAGGIPSKAATAAQAKKIYATGAAKGASKELVTEMCRWYRKGDKMTKEEASYIIENFDEVMKRYMDDELGPEDEPDEAA